LQNLICGFPRDFADELGFSDAPIEILYLIGKKTPVSLDPEGMVTSNG